MMKQILAVSESRETSQNYKQKQIDRILDSNIKNLSEDELRDIIHDIRQNKCRNWLN